MFLRHSWFRKQLKLSLAIKVGRHDPNAAQVQMVRFISITNTS